MSRNRALQPLDPSTQDEARPFDTHHEPVEFITVTEFARLAGVSKATLYAAVARGEWLAPVRLPGMMRWKREAAERWLRERTAEPRHYFGSAGRLS